VRHQVPLTLTLTLTRYLSEETRYSLAPASARVHKVGLCSLAPAKVTARAPCAPRARLCRARCGRHWHRSIGLGAFLRCPGDTGSGRHSPHAAHSHTAQVSVPSSAVFVLGDNGNLSADSHVWGCVPLRNVVGKAFYVLWPITHQGFVDQFMQDLEIEGVRAFADRLRS
jgi:hypothetical protein